MVNPVASSMKSMAMPITAVTAMTDVTYTAAKRAPN